MKHDEIEHALRDHWPKSHHQCRCGERFVVTSLLREHIAKAIAAAVHSDETVTSL